MDYSLEIIKTINELDDVGKYTDLRKDINCLYNMKLTNKYDKKVLDDIKNKYYNEIYYIDSLRHNMLTIKKIQPNYIDDNDNVSMCNYLIIQLSCILGIRLCRSYCSKKIDQRFESVLATDDKRLCEEIKLLIKQ